MTATVLVIDGGGRAAALAQKYSQSKHVKKLLVVPGNDLIRINTKKPTKIFPHLKTTDTAEIVEIAKKEKVDLVDVAQDDAIAVGVVDRLQKKGFKVFGPAQAAAQIEWDKAWARTFMRKNKIPVPDFKICNSQKKGIQYIQTKKDKQWFVKASGLAAGKGAFWAKNNQEAIEKIHLMKKFGAAGRIFLIEECLQGEEFSSFAIVDGSKFVIVGHAQDHKTVYNGDLGPNTGGMGCSSPPAVITEKIERQIESIFAKATNGLVKIKRPYQGILYLGGMINKRNKVYVIEFNARWGDPEAQVIIPALKNDLYQIANKTLNGKLKTLTIKKDNLYRVTITAASRGYPLDHSNVVGNKIIGFEKILKLKNVEIFGAGVKRVKGKYLAAGGRLFYVTAAGKNVEKARKIAYGALSQVSIKNNNLHYRTDIGYKDLDRFYKRA